MAELKPPDVSRSNSCESGSSISSFEGSNVSMHPWLYTDMENLRCIYGDSSVQYRLLESIDEIDVDLHIPLGFLDDVTAEAWKVMKSEPLVVRLSLSLSQYLEASNTPKVEVYQPSKKEKFGFGSQVRTFLENFIFAEWEHASAGYRKCLEAAEKMKKLKESVPLNVKAEVAKTDLISEIVSDDAVATLVNLGFDVDLARNALIITHGDVDDASRLIMDNPHECMAEGIVDKTTSETCVGSKPSPVRSISQTSDDGSCNLRNFKIAHNKEKTPIKAGIKRQLSHPPILNKLKGTLHVPMLTRTTSLMPGTSAELDAPRMMEDLNLMPLLTLDGISAKNIPSIAEGFLVQVFRYVRKRIPTVNEYCVVCDSHVFQNGAMLKPAVCSRELCIFAFQTLGVMADAAADIATDAEVVDLLINMTRAASKSNRKHIIFDPFPTVVDPKNPCNLMFTPKNPDYKLIRDVIDSIPTMNAMASMTSSLKQKLDQHSPSVYPLIQWIVTSSRSHIVKLPQEKHLDFMHTPHQFLLLSSPPAKEIAFQEAKKANGSTFAFHGSGIENWHSIIRQGLMSASGTKLQVNGAAYGKGVYLSPNSSTSMGYSKMGYGSHTVKKNVQSAVTPRYLKSDNITCIALCEVITSPYLLKNSSVWVCPNPDHVCTRFFFVYEDGQVGDSAINTQEDRYKRKIQKACGYKM